MFFSIQYLFMQLKDNQQIRKPLHGQNLQGVEEARMQKAIHRSIVAISCMTSQKRSKSASGIMIAKDLILTTASICYDHEEKSQNANFKVYIGANGTTGEYFLVEAWRYPLQYKLTQNAFNLRFNYALLKLAHQRLNQLQKCPQISWPCLECMNNKEKPVLLQIFGYPAIKQNYMPMDKLRRKIKLLQYGLARENRIVSFDIEKYEFTYAVHTELGQEGCPVIVNDKILGIHIKLGPKSQDISIGRPITIEMTDNLKKWRATLKGSNFMINEKCSIHTKKISENQLSANFKVDIAKKEALYKSLLQNPNNSILQINFEGLKGSKFTWKQISQFSKVLLPSLKHLDLKNNLLQDKGLEILCKNNYPKLQKINLNNNGITINGLRNVYYNKWSKQVQYDIFSVRSKQGGHHLHIDRYLPPIKRYVVQDIMDNLDSYIGRNRLQALNAIKLFMNTPLEEDELEKLKITSKKIQQKYIQRSKVQPVSLPTVLLQLKKQFNGLYFDDKSSIKSKLSSKLLFTTLYEDRISFVHHLPKIKFSFSQFQNKPEKIKEFEEWYLNFIQKQYKVDICQITIDKLTQGSICVHGSDSVDHAFTVNRPFFEMIGKDVQDFCNFFTLTQDQFDCAGNYQFPPIQRAEIQTRANIIYYQPVLGKRIGIKVKGIYDNGQNHWLKMDGNQYEWAVGFHGIKSPAAIFTKNRENKMVLKNIMEGRTRGQMLLPGETNHYQNDKALNKENEVVGKGVYVSPYFLSSLLDYSNLKTDKKFAVVMQCRLRPDKIKICPKPEYWVINQSQDLRPYGIILFTKEQIDKIIELNAIPQRPCAERIHKVIYKDQFTNATLIQKFCPKFNPPPRQE